jgi:small-conductance mechanosensitive channel
LSHACHGIPKEGLVLPGGYFVDRVMALGSAGVGSTVHVGSEESARQLREVSDLFVRAREPGMFAVLWCYLRDSAFRRNGVDCSLAADLTGQANHLGAAVDADLIEATRCCPPGRPRQVPGREVQGSRMATRAALGRIRDEEVAGGPAQRPRVRKARCGNRGTRRRAMTRDLTPDEVLISGGILVGGVLVALLLRVVLARLSHHAGRTRNGADDVILSGLRILLPWVAVDAGAWVGAAVLPLSGSVSSRVNHWLGAVLVLAVTLAAARVLAELVRTVALSRSGVAGSATIFVNIVRTSVLAVGVLVLLQSMGVSVAPLLTALGVGGLAVALALQDTLANLFAGVQILASKKVQPGDFIQLGTGEQGYVVDINWRNTMVRQLPDNLVIVPNAQIASSIVTNYYQPAQPMSVLVDVGVSYGSDLSHVELVTCEVGKEVMAEVEGGVAEHEPFIRYHTFGDSSINFSVILRAHEFTDQYLIKHEFIKRLHHRYGQEGIEIPFPIRTLVMPDRNGSAAGSPGWAHQPQAAPHASIP